MAVHQDLSIFTYKELQEMQLSHLDLLNKSHEELMQIASEKLERFRELPNDTKIPPIVIEKIEILIVNNKLPQEIEAPERNWSKRIWESFF